MNYKIILSNLQEAREELDRLESKLGSPDKPDEIELELSLRHAYHHLNFAWNIRNIEIEHYKNLTDSDFIEWGKFPNGFDDPNSKGEDESP